MTLLTVTVKEVGGREHVTEIPDDQPVSEIIPVLISKFGLPTHQHGDPLHYILDHVKQGKRLLGTETFAEAQVQENDVLLLLAEPRAGDSIG